MEAAAWIWAVAASGFSSTLRVPAVALASSDATAASPTDSRRAVTPAAFAHARLNDPAPINNVTGGLVLEVPVFIIIIL